MDSESIGTVSVVIATLDREQVLLETIGYMLGLSVPPHELILVDQTVTHTEPVRRRLGELDRTGRIRWILRDRPSIPAAMNAGLVAATGDIVLFLDDDVVPCGELVTAHREAHESEPGAVVAGQVLQPGESPEPLLGPEFKFCSNLRQFVLEFIGCNFSVPRAAAIELGGFDENFVGAAYRYEADFAVRWISQGRKIKFEPSAGIRHLRASTGGTRSWGHHLKTIRPTHAVGEYYFLLRHRARGTIRNMFLRLIRSVATRHHLRRPWWIPVSLFAESCGLVWATYLALGRPKLLRRSDGTAGDLP